VENIYFSFVYSDLAVIRMGISGSAERFHCLHEPCLRATELLKRMLVSVSRVVLLRPV